MNHDETTTASETTSIHARQGTHSVGNAFATDESDGQRAFGHF
jgi:hypothetical protein